MDVHYNQFGVKTFFRNGNIAWNENKKCNKLRNTNNKREFDDIL